MKINEVCLKSLAKKKFGHLSPEKKKTLYRFQWISPNGLYLSDLLILIDHWSTFLDRLLSFAGIFQKIIQGKNPETVNKIELCLKQILTSAIVLYAKLKVNNDTNLDNNNNNNNNNRC